MRKKVAFMLSRLLYKRAPRDQKAVLLKYIYKTYILCHLECLEFCNLVLSLLLSLLHMSSLALFTSFSFCPFILFIIPFLIAKKKKKKKREREINHIRPIDSNSGRFYDEEKQPEFCLNVTPE